MAALLLCLGAAESASADSWKRLRSGTGKADPPARTDHAMAAVRGSVYLFAGRTLGKDLGDLWRLDVKRRRWSRLSPPAPRPAARFGHNLVAERTGTLLLFGGQSSSGFFGDVWRFDPRTSRWTMLAATGPNPRYGAGAAIDPATGTLHITHGFTSDGRFDDTWSLAGDAFSETSGLGPRPLKRCLVQSAFRAGDLYLFGGQSNQRPFLGDLWRLDVATRAWKQLTPRRRPSARNLYAAARLRERWLIHGGNGRTGLLRDVWSLNLKKGTFTRLNPKGDKPFERSGHAAAALGDNRLVIFGGGGEATEYADTWVLRL